MRNKLIWIYTLVLIITFTNVRPCLSQSKLEAALAAMYRDCLFPGSNAFQSAIELTRISLAPGISNFIENNLAAIPLTPPNLELATRDGELVTAIAGMAPLYTEGSSTIGTGRFYVGLNYSFLNLSRIRGAQLSDLEFTFMQDGAGTDFVVARMPLDVDANVFTIYNTFGLTDRLDIGFALPIVSLSIKEQPTRFQIFGNDTGLLYGNFSTTADYVPVGDEATIFLPGRDPITRDPETNPTAPQSESYVSTIALRAKYRLPVSITRGAAAALIDVRIPVGRDDQNVLGKGNLGIRFTLIGEYARLSGFKPYVNLSGQYWDGFDSSSLKLASGFNQQLGNNLYFTFDLLGEIDLENNELLTLIDNNAAFRGTSLSNIPSLKRDNTLNGALGFQYTFSSRIHAYGSALFSLINSGLQSSIAPTFGIALHN